MSNTKGNGTGQYITDAVPIEYEFWGDKFPYVDKPFYDKIGLARYLCPKNTDFFIRANFNSDNNEYVYIFFKEMIW